MGAEPKAIGRSAIPGSPSRTACFPPKEMLCRLSGFSESRGRAPVTACGLRIPGKTSHTPWRCCVSICTTFLSWPLQGSATDLISTTREEEEGVCHGGCLPPKLEDTQWAYLLSVTSLRGELITFGLYRKLPRLLAIVTSPFPLCLSSFPILYIPSSADTLPSTLVSTLNKKKVNGDSTVNVDDTHTPIEVVVLCARGENPISADPVRHAE